MQVNSITTNYGASRALNVNKPVSKPVAPQAQPQVADSNFTSIYFTGNDKSDKSSKGLRNAAMAVLFPMALMPAATALQSCEKEAIANAYAYANADVNATAIANAEANAKACAKIDLKVERKGGCGHCGGDGCHHGHHDPDTVYITLPGTNDTIYIKGDNDTIYVPVPGEDRVDTVYINVPEPGKTDTIYVPVPGPTQTDTVTVTNTDTVYVQVPGEDRVDTVYVPKVDTVYVPRTDTVTVTNTDTVYVPKLDTVYVTKWDTCYIDTGSYVHDIDTIYLWKERYQRPIPLDTLTKHSILLDLDDVDSTKNRNVVHYEYTREWEYNDRVIANINVLESDMNKSVLVHDTEVKDYKGNHKYFGKEVRRIPQYPVTLQNKDGSTIKTKDGIFLEMYKNPGDEKGASIFDSELQNRYFLQTAGDSIKVWEYDSGNRYVERGKIGKGFLGKNTILLKDLIGNYSTEDHLVDVVIKAVDDDMLKEMYARARDAQDGTPANTRTTRSSAPRRKPTNDPNDIGLTLKTAAYRRNQ